MYNMLQQRGGKGYPPGNWPQMMVPPQMYGGQYPPFQHHHHHHHHQHQHHHQHHQQQHPRKSSSQQPQSRTETLRNMYDELMGLPPPYPAVKSKAAAMVIRDGRNLTFHASIRLPGKPTPEKVHLDVKDSVHDVKAVIEHSCNVPGAEIRLFHNGGELKDFSQTMGELGINGDTTLEVQYYNARDGWGEASLPDGIPDNVLISANGSHINIEAAKPIPGKKTDSEEWTSMKPGDAKVLKGYDRAPTQKGKELMDIYESVMSRPPQGTSRDPRADVACTYWSQKKFCKNGDSCPYSHAGARGQGGIFFQRPDPRAKVDCNFFGTARGCLRGNQCPFRHRKKEE